MLTLTSYDQLLRDVYPLPGTRLKQWVVDLQREQEWERSTCPTVSVPDHSDNTGMPCRNQWAGAVPWTHLDHDSCYTCGDLHEAMRTRADVVAWLALKAARPPITSDREALSDEVAPDLSLTDHPLVAMLRRIR